MCLGGSPSTPAPPPPPPPPPDAPIVSDGTVQGANATNALRAKAAGGVASTILTSPLGLAPASDGRKTLLGG